MNLATFVTTYMEKECEELMMDAARKNYIGGYRGGQKKGREKGGEMTRVAQLRMGKRRPGLKHTCSL